MADLIVIAVLAVVIGSAVAYIIRAKKRGVRCIGCSSGGTCGGNCSCMNLEKLENFEVKISDECSCGCHADKK